MQEAVLSTRALEALQTVRALRRLPTDTTKAQERVLTRAFKQISCKEQAIIALALEKDEQTTEVRRG